MSCQVHKWVTTAGGTSAVARAMGVTPQAVSQWIGNNQVPARRAAKFAALLRSRGIQVTVLTIRPDIFFED